MLKFLGILCIILFVSQQAECGKKDFRQIQTKMDYFLVSVIEVRQSLRDLREDVTSLQEQQNATVNWEPATAPSESEAGSSICPCIEIEPKMAVLEEGFQEEKSVLRREVQQQNKDIVTIATTVTDMKTKLDETLKEQDQAIDNVVRRGDDMKMEIQNKYEPTMSKVMYDISDTMKTIIGVNETLHGKYKGAINQYDTLSVKVDNVETNVEQVQGTLSGFDHRLLTIEHKLETTEWQIKIETYKSLGFKSYGSSWYKIHKKELGWSEAKEQCEADGLHLAEINDKNELRQVNQWMGNVVYWLGATDSEREGDWRWSTSGQVVHSSLWLPGQPDNAGPGGEDCKNGYPLYSTTGNSTDSEREGDWRWSTSGETVHSSLWLPDQPDNNGGEHCMNGHPSYSTTGVNDYPCHHKEIFICEVEM